MGAGAQRRELALAHDAQRPTSLRDALHAFWGLSSFEHFVDFSNATPSPDVSQLVPVVLRCAEAGDALAQEVLHHAGEELATIVRLLLRRLRAQSANPGFLPALAFAGSIMENVPPVRLALLRAVRSEFPEVQEVAGVVDPPLGALWRARHLHAEALQSNAVVRAS